MKTAVIGIGVIGHVHLDVLRECVADIVAVCDIDPEKTKNIDGVKKYTDYKKMLDNEDIDVVHICTPHYLHAPMAVYALERNINVLCEKPLCISEEQIEQVLEAEKKSHAMLGVCFQNRYNKSSILAKEYLKGKTVTTAHATVSWHRDAEYYKSGAWRGKIATEGGGVLINQAIHTLDLLQWLCGYPHEVYANCENYLLDGIIEVEDTVSAVFKGDGSFDFFATTSASDSLPVQTVIKAGNDIITLMPDSIYINGKLLEYDENKTYFGKCDYGGGHASLIADFYRCVQNGEKFPIDGTEGAKVMRLVFGVYKSKGKKTVI